MGYSKEWIEIYEEYWAIEDEVYKKMPKPCPALDWGQKYLVEAKKIRKKKLEDLKKKYGFAEKKYLDKNEECEKKANEIYGDYIKKAIDIVDLYYGYKLEPGVTAAELREMAKNIPFPKKELDIETKVKIRRLGKKYIEDIKALKKEYGILD